MSLNSKVYLDFAASTPIDGRVFEAMLPYFSEQYGNPSSTHHYGQQAEGAVEQARESVADCMNCMPQEIVFTSCGTESDNLALRGTALFRRRTQGSNHILITPVEHHAVSHTALQLQEEYGFVVETIPVDRYGLVDPRDVAHRIKPSTAIVSVIYANNEIGSINRISEISKICRESSIPFHTDAVQAAAYLPLDLQNTPVDLMSIGAHKFYGPKGVGVLYIKNGIKLLPHQTGGGQEFNLRAGTLNVPYIVGLAKALELVKLEHQERRDSLVPLRNRIIGRILEEIPNTQLTGHPEQRLPNHASFVFDGANGNTLMMLLDAAGFSCSSGSACKTGNPEPSDVLLAMGLSRSWALGSLRVTLGNSTTPEMVDDFLNRLPGLVEQARRM